MLSRIAATLCIGLALAAGVCSAENRTGQAEQTYRIGVIGPLSGPAAPYGNWVRIGAEMAAAEFRAQNPKITLELIFEDDACKGPEALSAYRKLTQIDQVPYILGPLCQASVVPLLAAAEKEQTVLLTTGMPTETVRRGGPSVFTLLPAIAEGAALSAEFAVSNLHLKRIALLSLEDEFGNETADAFRKAIAKSDSQIVADETYPRGATDFRALLMRVKARQADGLFFVGYGPELVAGMKQLKESGLELEVLGSPVIQTPDVGNALKGISQPIYYSYPGRSDSSTAQQFAETFNRTHRTTDALVPMYAGAAYDGIKLLVPAITKCGQAGPECVIKQLSTVENYAGANGPLTFDAQGNNTATNAYEMRVFDENGFRTWR